VLGGIRHHSQLPNFALRGREAGNAQGRSPEGDWAARGLQLRPRDQSSPSIRRPLRACVKREVRTASQLLPTKSPLVLRIAYTIDAACFLLLRLRWESSIINIFHALLHMKSSALGGTVEGRAAMMQTEEEELERRK
jgi:hypothetical protein